MSLHVSSFDLEVIYREIMQRLQQPDYKSAPRGNPIREFIGASFELLDPRSRLIMSPARAANYGFAVGELCWYLRGDTDLETMLYYNKRMGQFSDDGKTINSAYGAKIFNTRWAENRFSGSGDDAYDRSQFSNVVAELKRDPDSRRAVMHINEPPDLLRAVERGSKDVPCTMSIQLLIRDRLLHMHVLMRSNDVVWGLPYDVFSFTCLQEVFLYRLQAAGVPVDDLGSYHHTAGSLHVYAPHYDMSRSIAMEERRALPPMKPFTLAGMEELAEEIEPAVRRGHGPPVTGYLNNESEVWMVGQLIDHRHKRTAEDHERGLRELARLSDEYQKEKENT